MAVPNLTPNSPVAGSIAWGAFNIQYGGVSYSVAAGSTPNKYVWWQYNSGSPSLQAGNTLPTNLTADDIMLFVNKAGIPVNVQASTVIDGSLVVDGSIIGTAIAAGTVHGDRIQGGTLTIGHTNGLQSAIDGAESGAVTQLKDLWGYDADQTTIDGRNIFTGTIAAKQLALGDFTNLIADGDLADPNFANWGTGMTRVPPSGTNVPAYMEWATTGTGNTHRYNNNFFECFPGDKFYLTCEVSTPATNTNTVTVTGAIQTSRANGTTVTWPAVSTPLPPNTGWTTLSGVITIPAGDSIRGQFDPFSNAGATGQVVRMRRMSLRRMNGGELIVDGAIKAAQLDANAITSKHTITGPVFQTNAAANRGIKIVSSANNAFGSLIAYDAQGNAHLTINGETGSITMEGDLTTGSKVTGGTITGGTVQTQVEASRGIKMTSAGLIGYDGSGNAKFTLTPTGGLTVDNPIVTTGTITGATITGGVLQTVNTAFRGIKIVNNKLMAYPSTATSDADANFVIDGTTGSVSMKGTLTGASVISGNTTVTGRIETVAGNGSKAIMESGSLKMFSNVAGEVATGGMTAGSWVWNGVTAAQTTLESPRVSGNAAGRVRVWQGNDGKAGAEMWASADTSVAVDDTSGLIHMNARAGRILFNGVVKDFKAPVNFRNSYYLHPATASPPDNNWRRIYTQTWIPWPAGASYAHVVMDFPGNTDTALNTDSYYNLLYWSNKDSTEREIAVGYSHNNGGANYVNMGGTLSGWVNTPQYGATDNYLHIAVNAKATGGGWVALRSGSLNVTFFS